MKPIRVTTDATVIAVAHLVAEMLKGVHDARELAELTGLNLCTVYRYQAAFHRAHAAHICGWKKDPRGAQTIRVFKLGEGVDVMPVRETHAEKQRRLRRKWKAEATREGTRFTQEAA